MKVVGLTGPTGAGKTTVCAFLAGREGIAIIDCDRVARKVVGKGRRCLLDLAVEFSPVIIGEDGTLNRRRLAGIVFQDKEKLKRLNEIIFPHVLEEIEQRLEDARRQEARVAVLDAPTLFESGACRLCGAIVAVIASPGLRAFRIIRRDGLDAGEAEARMGSQRNDEYYTSRADFVIQNDGDEASLRLQTLEMMTRLGL
jgi:dephospho-CoA kinase